MPRYSYDKLFISTYPEKIHFNTQDLRAAVERLRGCDQEGFTALTVETTLRPGGWRVVAPAALKLSQIEGHAPPEVWEMFDRQIDQQANYWAMRAAQA